jgi:hypothetical protein
VRRAQDLAQAGLRVALHPQPRLQVGIGLGDVLGRDGLGVDLAQPLQRGVGGREPLGGTRTTSVPRASILLAARGLGVGEVAAVRLGQARDLLRGIVVAPHLDGHLRGADELPRREHVLERGRVRRALVGGRRGGGVSGVARLRHVAERAEPLRGACACSATPLAWSLAADEPGTLAFWHAGAAAVSTATPAATAREIHRDDTVRT